MSITLQYQNGADESVGERTPQRADPIIDEVLRTTSFSAHIELSPPLPHIASIFIGNYRDKIARGSQKVPYIAFITVTPAIDKQAIGQFQAESWFEYVLADQAAIARIFASSPAQSLPTALDSGQMGFDIDAANVAIEMIVSVPQEESAEEFEAACRTLDDHIGRVWATVESLASGVNSKPNHKDSAPYSCFISYNHADKVFARQLHDRLQAHGLSCWLDEKQILPGQDIYDEVDRGIRGRDKVLLCCSQQSLNSWWVDNEIGAVLEKEQQLTKESGQKVLALIPLDLDGYLLTDKWKSGYRAQIRRRLVADFTGWQKDSKKFERSVAAVMRALNAEQMPDQGETPPSWLRLRSRWVLGATLLAGMFVLAIAYIFGSRPPVSQPTNEDQQELFFRKVHLPISGYLAVSCNTCERPRAWAFYVPEDKGDTSDDYTKALLTIVGKGSAWPTAEFLYPDNKPHIGNCVDFPKSVCPSHYHSPWTPTTPAMKAPGQAPSLRLDLRLPITGWELSITNEGGSLAQGINLDVVAWQIGAPGAEFRKSYVVRDLSPFGDFNMAGVFGEYHYTEKEK